MGRGVTGGFKACFTINALAQAISGTSVTPGEIALFSISASINEKGLSMDRGFIRSKDKETEHINDCKGEYIATNSGAVVTNDYTFDITIGDDYSYMINNLPGNHFKDVFKEILEGGTFEDGDGNTWSVIGTNGQRWLGGNTPEVAQPFGNLYLLDGKLKDSKKKNSDGTWFMHDNTSALTFSDTPLCCVELNYDFGAGNYDGVRVPYAFCTNNTLNEGSGAGINMHGLSFKRLSDVVTIEKYTKEGVSKPEVIETDAVIKNGVNVDYIEANGTGSAPSSGAVGSTAVVVNTTDGVITTYNVPTTVDTFVEVTGVTYLKGAKIYGQDTDTNKAGYIVGSGEGTNTKATTISTGQYILPVKEFSIAERKFADYTI